MKLSKLLALLLAVLMIVSVFAACSSTGEEGTEAPTDVQGEGEGEGEGDDGGEATTNPEEEIVESELTLSDDKTTITHWTGYSGADRSTLEPIWEDFNTTDEIGQIQASIMTWPILDQKMATAYASDTGPDTLCGGTALRTNWYQGFGCDMTSAYDSGELTLDIYPQAIVDDMSFDGGIWSTPMCAFGVCLYYDVDMLAAAGYTAGPTTQDEMIEMARALTIKDDSGEVTQYGLAIGYDLMWTTFLWNAGYDVVDLEQNGKSIINADGVAELLETVSGYVRDEQLSPIILDNGNMMINDKLAMYTNGPWDTTLLTDGGVNFDVCNIPGEISGLANHYIPTSWLLEGDENKFQAFVNFSKHWLEEENQIAWCKGSGYPLLRSDMDPADLGDSWAAKFTEAMENRTLKAVSQIPGLAGVDGDTGILANLWQQACYGEITDYQAALDDAAAQIDAEVEMVGYTYNG